MGGHGGLNILPQKKWNVYNYENREVVARDVRKAEEQKQMEAKQNREMNSAFNLEILQLKKRQKGIASHSPYKDQPEVKDFVNFFREEERQNQVKQERKTDPFQDKPFDQTTRFNGQHSTKPPWYLQLGDRLQQREEWSDDGKRRSYLGLDRMDQTQDRKWCGVMIDKVIKKEKDKDTKKKRKKAKEEKRRASKKARKEERARYSLQDLRSARLAREEEENRRVASLLEKHCL